MHAYIFILFQSLGWMALLVDRPVPEAIRDPVAIKVRGPFVQTLCIEKDSYMDTI